MQKTPKTYTYGYGLPFLFITGILIYFKAFEGERDFTIFGFFVFLIVLLKLLDKITLFQNIKSDLALLIGYATIITAILYLPQSYSALNATFRLLEQRWYVAILGAAGCLPALFFKALYYFLDAPIPYKFMYAVTHYPFAVGFWLLWLLLTLTIRFYERMGQRTVSPMLHLLLIYNLCLGALAASFSFWTGGVMIALSVIVWIYFFFPRLGIPMISRSKRQQREIHKAGQEIEKAQQRVDKVLRNIDKI